MNIHEFVTAETFRIHLSIENPAKEKNSNKNKHYKTLMAGLSYKYPDLRFRDYLDTDGTFGVISSEIRTLSQSVGMYQDVVDYIKETTYMEHTMTGLVELEMNDIKYSGFWILLR